MNKEIYENQVSFIQKLMDNGDFGRAEKEILKVIAVNPKEVNYWVLLADVLSAQQYYIDAYNIIQKVRLFDPQSTWIESTLMELEIRFGTSSNMKYNINELFSIPKVTVAAAMIIKDDKNNIHRWYESLKNSVDEIIIVDTGSTDGTREILGNLDGAIIVDFQWRDDFAAARNSALPLINSEWVIWIDSDEYLHSKEAEFDSIRFVAGYYLDNNDYPIIKLEIIDTHRTILTSSFDSPRMFSMKPGYKFEGRIHEQIVLPSNDQTYAVNTGIKVYHDGYTSEILIKKNKIQRNINLLKLNLKEHPEDYASLSLIGREYKLQNNFNVAVKYLEQAERLMVELEEYDIILDTYQHLAEIYASIGDVENLDIVIDKMLSVESNFPDAIYMKNLRLMEKAVSFMNEALQGISGIKDSFDKYRGNISADQELLIWKADFLKAGILRNMGYLNEAKLIYQDIEKRHDSLNFSQQLKFIESQGKDLNK